MEARSLRYVVSACGGLLKGGSLQTQVRSVCTDSRRIQAGDLFFALEGERFDGHQFLTEAAAKGVAAIVAARNKVPADFSGCAVITVEDTRKALGRLAAAYRADFTLPITAVGGSNGKTTTKELAASVLRQKLQTLWSEASFNNDIGVPVTLLKLEASHQAAVMEVGTNHPGEMAPLLQMIQPCYGIITSIGREHLEFFGDVVGVAREQGSLAEVLPAEGKLFVPGDNEWTQRIIERSRASVVRIGCLPANEWRISGLRPDKSGVTFRVDAPTAEFTGEYRIHLLGSHQAVSAVLALALGAEVGLDRAASERGLADCQPAKMRLQLWEHNGVRVLDDAYNANADSMLAALQTLQELPCKGRRVAVLGDMAELGVHSEAAHAEVGRRAAELGIGQLFAVGKMAPVMGRAARSAGLNRVFEFEDVETAAAAVKSFVKQGDILLLKASRASRLERVSERLRRGENGRAH
jgi:UDP-N-acetylmuramoyl-tripeptide--D-alanyl-D-alanine ligase